MPPPHQVLREGGPKTRLRVLVAAARIAAASAGVVRATGRPSPSNCGGCIGARFVRARLAVGRLPDRLTSGSRRSLPGGRTSGWTCSSSGRPTPEPRRSSASPTRWRRPCESRSPSEVSRGAVSAVAERRRRRPDRMVVGVRARPTPPSWSPMRPQFHQGSSATDRTASTCGA